MEGNLFRRVCGARLQLQKKVSVGTVWSKTVNLLGILESAGEWKVNLLPQVIYPVTPLSKTLNTRHSGAVTSLDWAIWSENKKYGRGKGWSGKMKDKSASKRSQMTGWCLGCEYVWKHSKGEERTRLLFAALQPVFIPAAACLGEHMFSEQEVEQKVLFVIHSFVDPPLALVHV